MCNDAPFLKGLSRRDKNEIAQWARKHPEIKRVWLFGSRAQKRNRADSDIDLAIEMIPTAHDDPFNVWLEWHDRYEKSPDLHLTHEVDLEWYEKGAGLERVAPSVERFGVLLYSIDVKYD